MATASGHNDSVAHRRGDAVEDKIDAMAGAAHSSLNSIVPPAPLKLKAVDSDDLEIISTCLQDAALTVGQLVYDKLQKRLGIVASRFMWEAPPVLIDQMAAQNDPFADAQDALFPCQVYQRIQTRFWIEQVSAAACRNIDHSRPDDMLALLAITLEAPDAAEPPGSQTLILRFAGNKAVRLTVPVLRCYLEDFGEPWPTIRCPEHKA